MPLKSSFLTPVQSPCPQASISIIGKKSRSTKMQQKRGCRGSRVRYSSSTRSTTNIIVHFPFASMYPLLLPSCSSQKFTPISRTSEHSAAADPHIHSHAAADIYSMIEHMQKDEGIQNRCSACYRIFKSASALLAHMESPSTRCRIRETKGYGNAIHIVSRGFLGAYGMMEDGTMRLESQKKPESF